MENLRSALPSATMARRKNRVKPTNYPRVPFHIIRSAQLLSSIVVASIMSFFLKELAREHYRLPWTFTLLFSVSLLTIVSLTITIVLHCCYGLNPTFNCFLNSGLALVWSVSFSLLAWWSSATLTHACNIERWEDTLGINICRLYKTLFSFALVGLVSTLLALGLDFKVRRNATQRGQFHQLQTVDAGDGHGFPGTHEREADSGLVAAPGGSGHRKRGGQGYAQPVDQFAYNDDTSYQGAGGEVRHRS